MKQPTAISPKLRFQEFRNSPTWETKPLGSLVTISTEKVGDNECVPMSITSGVGLVSQMEKFGRIIAGESYKNYLLLKRNDFAYNKSATKEYPEGFIALYSGEALAAVPNSIFTCFRINGDLPIPQYLNYQFLGNLHGRWLKKFIEVSARAHGSLSIGDDDLLALPVPLPGGKTTRAEQQKIAECLSTLDELIGAESRKLEALKAHKKGLMQQLFPREGETLPPLRFPEFHSAPGWRERKLDDILESITNGLSVPQNGGVDGFRVTRIETISSQVIDLTKVGFISTDQDVSSYKLQIGDILLSNINSVSQIGKTAFVSQEYDLYHGMNLLRLIVNRAEHYPHFVYYLLNTDCVRDSFRARANKAVNQASINQTELGRTVVTLPKKEEQCRIATCLSSLDDLIAAQSDRLSALQTHKQGLMQQIFPSPAEVEA